MDKDVRKGEKNPMKQKDSWSRWQGEHIYKEWETVGCFEIQ